MSIDSCYHDVISKLTNQCKIKAISQKLLSLTTNDERVFYVHDILKSMDAFPTALEVRKTENMSTHYRNLGNQCFQNKEDYKAWQYYILSLLHAPLDSDNYCLALANRSAVFFSMKKYKECLQDINEVFSLKYPNKLKEKLIKRQESCKEHLSNTCDFEENGDILKSEIENLLKLDSPTDDRFPCASKKLEVVFHKEMGRHVIAQEDIKVGEVLVIEEPYFTLLLKSQYLFSCSYCLSRELNLLPCPNCCFSLYCSTNCKANAWRDYHSVECTLMPTLVELNFTKLELLALRTAIKARSDHPNWDSLYKTIQETESHLNTEFRGHVKVCDKWVYDSKYYASIHSLASNIEKRSVSDIFQKSVTAAVFLDLLINKTEFLKDENEDVETMQRCVAGNLLLHLMTSPTNMHGLSSNIQTADGNFVEEVSLASAPYAFHSLINHSCAPNVVRADKLGTGQMTLYALRPIKKGMQIFDNYGSHHALQDRETRQQDLRFQYKFTCICEACINNWPMYLSLKPARNVSSKVLRHKDKLLDSHALEHLQKGDKGTALKLFKPLCNLAEVLEPYAPCRELADCQEAIKQCMIIFKGLVPYWGNCFVEWDAVAPKV